MARGKGTLEQVFEIGALAVLHVIDVPRPCGSIFDPLRQPEKAISCIDVARLRGNHENRVDPLHREDLNDPAERALGLGLKYSFELARDLGRIAIANREQGVGSA